MKFDDPQYEKWAEPSLWQAACDPDSIDHDQAVYELRRRGYEIDVLIPVPQISAVGSLRNEDPLQYVWFGATNPVGVGVELQGLLEIRKVEKPKPRPSLTLIRGGKE